MRRVLRWLFNRYARCNMMIWVGPKPAFPLTLRDGGGIDDLTNLDNIGRLRRCFLWSHHAGDCKPDPES